MSFSIFNLKLLLMDRFYAHLTLFMTQNYYYGTMQLALNIFLCE